MEQVVPEGHIGFHIVNKVTLVVEFDQIVPECLVERGRSPALPAAICLEEDHVCAQGGVCMPAFARRVQGLFKTFPDVRLIVCRFDRPDQRVRAAVANRDMNLRVIRCNKRGLALVLAKASFLLGKVPVGF